jgi:hypothetical protein
MGPAADAAYYLAIRRHQLPLTMNARQEPIDASRPGPVSMKACPLSTNF